ncbi:hypothetical protein CASFOL_040957 [Castilleja foliolosa]|uniref:Uncharacterized protein n=1 Tax=Castilleja foliolosa TaxID=1961234 RepID=A0ABD3BDY8_9LAMI
MARLLVASIFVVLLAAASFPSAQSTTYIGYPAIGAGRIPGNPPAVPGNPYGRGCTKAERCGGRGGSGSIEDSSKPRKNLR